MKQLRQKIYWLGLFSILISYCFQNILLQSSVFRRAQIPQGDLITTARDALGKVLSDPEAGQASLQYGLTLGSKELRTQLAKILAGMGIKSDLNNLGIFHNFSEVMVLLGEVFINPGDVVYYQSPQDLSILQVLAEYYGAELKQLPSSGFLPNNNEGRVKLVYISNSKQLSPEAKEILLAMASKLNFLIIERSLNGQSDGSELKLSDKEGRVLFLGAFSEIPVLSSLGKFIPLVYLEASSKLMEKIEIAKGALTLCTNSLLQGMLIKALSSYVDGEEVNFENDETQISSEELQNLLSSRGERLMPSEIREILKYASIEGLLYLAGGVPDPQLFPLDKVLKIVNSLTPEEWMEVLNYSSHKGLPELRVAMAKYISEREGIKLTADNVLITNGSQQALDLIGRFAERGGRKIITESPTYLGMLTAAVPHIGKENILHMDLRTPQGLNNLSQYLTQAMQNGVPAPVIYLTPTFGNPAGYLWTEQERRNLIDVVKSFRNQGYDVLIIEDDPYGELNYTGLNPGEELIIAPSFLSMYPEGVIYLATNSKVFSPGSRVGYIVGDNQYMDEFAQLMEELEVEVPALPQLISAEFISSGMLKEHIQVLRREYAEKAKAMNDALERYMPKGVTWTPPQGGLFVWVEIPQEWGLDLKALLQNKAVKGVNINGEVVRFAYVPGVAFSIDGSTNNAVRLCFATATVEEIYKAIYAFAELIRQHRR
ncbi:MAG TPA: aminotransferase class I/II-fold pyridoxal phosphate-dependent enzyme [Candidatus Omnitrophica bacterium]|nr:aminotransferase class I/II-fold pyridoxal phosphate-dependent enzyme [Candidatus Omnitrophota bacterium]